MPMPELPPIPRESRYRWPPTPLIEPFKLADRLHKVKVGQIKKRKDCCDEVEQMSRYLEDLRAWCYLVWDRLWGTGGGEAPPPPPGWP
jgi:hypothetical protein